MPKPSDIIEKKARVIQNKMSSPKTDTIDLLQRLASQIIAIKTYLDEQENPFINGMNEMYKELKDKK